MGKFVGVGLVGGTDGRGSLTGELGWHGSVVGDVVEISF